MILHDVRDVKQLMTERAPTSDARDAKFEFLASRQFTAWLAINRLHPV